MKPEEILLPKQLVQKCTTHAMQVMQRAARISRTRQEFEKVCLSHLLRALFEEDGGLGANVLRAHHLGPHDLLQVPAADVPDAPRLPEGVRPLELSRSVKSALKKALWVAAQFHHKYLGTEHLLYGIICEALKQNDTQNAKDAESISSDKDAIVFKGRSRQKFMDLKRHIEEIFSSTTRFPDIDRVNEEGDNFMLPLMLMMPRGITPATGPDGAEEVPYDGDKPVPARSPISPRSGLSGFCEDLVLKAERGQLDPLVGREDEVDRLMHILARRMKNNPVLIGEPGVGKTAIVQGLALRIAQGNVPENLVGKRILALDLGSLVAGTMFRGEFEARLKEVLKEAKSKRVILFIDEIHTVVGAGASPGSLDAANMLKPALSQGLIQVIGATTLDEYRKSIEKDPALERRFQPIHVKEQSEEEAIRIITGIKDAYEKHHHLSISEEAIRSAVALSERYLTDRFLPDKAIDVLDEAAAYVHSKVTPTGGQSHIQEHERALEQLHGKKERAIEQEQYEEALKFKKEIEEFEKELAKLRDAKKKKERQFTAVLGEDDIRHTIARMTGIPVEKLEGKEAKELKAVDKVLERYIIGQHDAAEQVSRVLKRARAGLTNPRRPLGSFIFLGPTGVGKTELAKILAAQVYHDQDALIKFDMSEFSEPHSVSKLIGAPPGYVGYEDEGKLTERVRRSPYAIILFDEIEKAHPVVFNVLLQVLEDGELTSASGRKVSFRNTVIIMTSNIGTDEFTTAATAMGFSNSDVRGNTQDLAQDLEARFEQIREDALKELRSIMRPELLNRIDAIVVFRPLDKKAIQRITELELAYLADRLKQNKKLAVVFAASVSTFIAKEAFNPREGARPIRRAIEQHIENALAEKLIDLDVKEGDALTVSVAKGKVTVVKNTKKAP